MTNLPDLNFDRKDRPVFEWRGRVSNDELNILHAECFEHAVLDEDWWARLNAYSLGWVCLRQGGRLVGFVNVAWDGGVHAFLLDTLVTTPLRRHGHGTRLVEEAIKRAAMAGCEWMHVDFEPHLRPFYVSACGFENANAGLFLLHDLQGAQPS